jgi:putative pyruvate formate lyase activating enzyme
MTAGERHTLVLTPDGTLIVPDQTDALRALAAELGAPPAPPLPSRLGPPRLLRTRAISLPLAAPPADLPTAILWRWHARGAGLFRARRKGCGAGRGEVSWLAVKQELARRLLGPVCGLCARGCAADRRAGESGFCGLGDTWRPAAVTRLWGEEAELGRPGLALAARGCGLRCAFCYRPEYWPAQPAIEPPQPLPPAEHWHFLGGNPDESLPGILDWLAPQEEPRPVVWNTHAYLRPAGTALLEGLADAVVADLKFGPGDCAQRLAGVTGYWPAATRALATLARFELRLIVRHVALPGHLECCAQPAAAWARAHLPAARVRVLPQYEPFGAARRGPELGRRLSSAELAAVAALGDDPETKGWREP